MMPVRSLCEKLLRESFSTVRHSESYQSWPSQRGATHRSRDDLTILCPFNEIYQWEENALCFRCKYSSWRSKSTRFSQSCTRRKDPFQRKVSVLYLYQCWIPIRTSYCALPPKFDSRKKLFTTTLFKGLTIYFHHTPTTCGGTMIALTFSTTTFGVLMQRTATRRQDRM